MRYFLHPVKLPDILKALEGGREATMHAQNLTLHQGTKRKIVKEICKDLPDIGVAVLPETLVVEPIDLCDLPAFVVSSQQRQPTRILDFETKKEADGLHGIKPSVHVITQKQIVGKRQIASDFKKLNQIVKLAMDVATNGDGALQ
jgi:hypothetical protein